MHLIIFSELKPQKGIPYCRDHLRRLWKSGKFPKPVDVGPGRLAWVEEEIDRHIAEMVAKRDEQAANPATAPSNNPDASSGGPRKNTTRPRTIERQQASAQPRQQYRSSRRSS
jgi:prophage regulatory protein